MYITTDISGTVNQTECPVVNQTECPVVCGQPLQTYVSLLGTVFGLLCLAAYLTKKRFFLHVRAKKKKLFAKILSVLFWIFLALFLLYFLKVEYQLSGGCSIDGILLKGRLLPDIFSPLFEVR